MSPLRQPSSDSPRAQAGSANYQRERVFQSVDPHECVEEPDASQPRPPQPSLCHQSCQLPLETWEEAEPAPTSCRRAAHWKHAAWLIRLRVWHESHTQ